MEKQMIVGVKFDGFSGGKSYYFNPKDKNYEINDKVIVETSHGLSMGVVSIKNTLVEKKEILEPLKCVIRKATEKDLKTAKHLKEREKFAVSEARKLSEKMKLNMQVTSAEFSFDESKVIINFTADDRVDFRELVKSLAGILRARIELRQIGTRDKAKLLGGIGCCGREVCCKKFLKDFEKVNIKMAKNQSVSLNPNNINGLCGRLKCCLAYENDTYVQIMQEMPVLNTKVKTKDGIGVVCYNDLLKKRVSVKITKGESDFEIIDYPLEEIEICEK